MAIVYRFLLLYTLYRCKNCHIFADIFNKSSMLGSGKIWHLRNMEIPAPTVLGDGGSLKFMAPFTDLCVLSGTSCVDNVDSWLTFTSLHPFCFLKIYLHTDLNVYMIFINVSI